MKNINLVPSKMCLILVIVFGISALTLADIASETNKKAEQHFEKANELLKRADYEAAIAEYKKVINMSPNSKIALDAQYWIGQAQFRAGQFDAALSTFEKLIEEYPTSAIVPAAKVMSKRVQEAKEKATSDTENFTDPCTGLQFKKIATVVDEPPFLHYSLSPNGKFMLAKMGMTVVPLEGGEPFMLVDFPGSRAIWSPDGEKVAFYSGYIWVIPVSPDTARPTGPARKLIEGDYWAYPPVAWSPDSQRFAYLASGEDRHLWAFSLEDGSRVRITDEPVYGRPAWSPDGKWIADKKMDKYIWLFPVKGGPARKLVEADARARLYWSPDGNWIFWQKKQKLHFVRVADEMTLDVNLPMEVGEYLSWSSDGKKMLFYQPAHKWQISLKIVPASGGAILDPLKERLYSGVGQYWTPDSKFIATYDWGRYWVIPIAGGKPFPLELNVGMEQDKLWQQSLSPDCKKLLFVPQKEERWVVPVSIEQGQNTGKPVKVFDRPKAKHFEWSPDGSKLAVVCEDDIWIASTDGSPPVRLTETPEREFAPQWYPDGKSITWISYTRSTKRYILYVCKLPGGKPRKLVDVPGAYRYRRSNDQTKVAYRVDEGKKTTLWTVTVPAGEPKKLMEVERNRRRRGFTYAFSPNGQELAVMLGGKLSAFSLSSSKRREIAEVSDPTLVRHPRIFWSPDGQTLVVWLWSAPEKGDLDVLFTVPAKGGEMTALVPEDLGQKYLLDWSPDGKWIAYSSDRAMKVHPEGVIWEVDFDQILKKASR